MEDKVKLREEEIQEEESKIFDDVSFFYNYLR